MQKQILLAQQTNQTQQTQKTHVIAITSPDLVVQSPVEEEEEVIELPEQKMCRERGRKLSIFQ